MAVKIWSTKKLHPNDLLVEISGLQLSVASNAFQQLVVQLPFGADVRTAQACMTADGELQLILPYRPLKDWWTAN